jgi:hypothetical protein
MKGTMLAALLFGAALSGEGDLVEGRSVDGHIAREIFRRRCKLEITARGGAT